MTGPSIDRAILAFFDTARLTARQPCCGKTFRGSVPVLDAEFLSG
jgi:hypothetical protein